MTPAHEFFRFPRTPHLLSLGNGLPRGDKLLPASEVRRFFESEVTIEEKVDGTNIGFSVDASGALRVQSRGGYVEPNSHSQFAPLRRWMSEHRASLVDALGTDLILFGEWCVAVHSIEYARLPDWFLAFDVFDRTARLFWSSVRRNTLCQRLRVSEVPLIAKGRFTEKALTKLVGPSMLGAPFAEGIYVRIEGSDFLTSRAKVVSARFHRSIGEHWSGRKLRLNHLISGPS